MGRIVSHITSTNPVHTECAVPLNGLVDTGASALFLPDSYQPRLGEMEELEPSFCTFADGSRKLTRRYGPVKIQLDGFPTIYNEVMFLPPDAEGQDVEPLIGISCWSSPALVLTWWDTVYSRLILMTLKASDKNV